MAELGLWKRRNSREMREQGNGSIPWCDVTRGHSEWECVPFLAFLAFPHSVLLQSINQSSHPFAPDLISPHSPPLIPRHSICSNSLSTFSLILTLLSSWDKALSVAWSLELILEPLDNYRLLPLWIREWGCGPLLLLKSQYPGVILIRTWKHHYGSALIKIL